jgi:glycosyltransferase involved in cell wall biosynthesis
VAVAPLRIARGTQNKILETMAMAIATVTSPVAARGVDAEPGRHLLTAATAEEFAATVLRLLEDPAERQALGTAARARVLSHHGWARSMEMLDRLLAERLPALTRPAGGDAGPVAVSPRRSAP